MPLILYLYLSLFLSSDKAQGFNPFERLPGNWSGKAGTEDYSETWQKSGVNYHGSSISMKAGQKISEEKISILTDRGRIIYRAEVAGQLPVDFTLEKMKPDTLWFSNLSHDFPKHIVYVFRGDSLLATISGEPFGQQSLTIRLRKK